KHWSITHHPRWLVVLRVALGICLFVKGISFMMNAVTLQELISNDMVISKGINWLPLFITWAHLLGGFLIIIGLYTRVAVIFQIPILIGAVIFIMTKEKMFGPGSELAFALVILVLLFFFLIEGSGPISLDNHFSSNMKNNLQ
ncbi:MAG TPA: DoxX family protein, partial [Puia sp.]|nr:DoxX family protein [Puia sp.]